MIKRCALAIALALSMQAGSVASSPQSTAFTYQGRLSANGQPADGNYDLAFRLFDAAEGGTQVVGESFGVLVAGSGVTGKTFETHPRQPLGDVGCGGDQWRRARHDLPAQHYRIVR